MVLHSRSRCFMEDRMVVAACLIFIGILVLIIVMSISMYRIGYNNGYDTGYKDARTDRRRERVKRTDTYQTINHSNRRYNADSVKILPPRSERPVYIDGRSKYRVNLSKQNKNYR